MTSDQERAAPAQQPVAWRWRVNYRDDWCWSATKPEFSSSDLSRGMVSDVHPLYDHPSSEPELRAEIVHLQAEVADERYLRIEAAKRWEAAESRVEALSAEVGTARASAFEEAAQVAEAERKQHDTGSGFDSQPAHAAAFRIREAIRSRAALDKGATT